MNSRGSRNPVRTIGIIVIVLNALLVCGLLLLTFLRSYAARNSEAHFQLYAAVYRICLWLWYDLWIGRYLLFGLLLSLLASFFAKAGKLWKTLLVGSFIAGLVTLQLCLPALAPF